MTKEQQELLNEIKRQLDAYNLSVSAGERIKDLFEALNTNEYRTSEAVKSLFDDIARICKTGDERFMTVLPKGTKVYRSRIVDDISDQHVTKKGIQIKPFTKGYDWDNSKEPPFGLAPSGRNNLKGVSYFYASDNPQTSCSEIIQGPGQMISLAEFELADDVKVVDLVKVKTFTEQEIRDSNIALGKYWSEIMFSYSKPVSNESEYRITQVISEEFRKNGAAGVKYKSYYSNGNNFTFFNCSTDLLQFKNSRLLLAYCSNNIILDFDNQTVLESFPHFDYAFDNKMVSDLKERIIASWLVSRSAHSKAD